NGFQDDPALRMIRLQPLDQFMEIRREVLGEILSAVAVVDAVADEHKINPWQLCNFLGIAALEQALSIFAVPALVDYFSGRQVLFRSKEFANYVLQVVGFGRHMTADAADDRAVSQKQDANFRLPGVVGLQAWHKCQ